jgi:hypothetical protein
VSDSVDDSDGCDISQLLEMLGTFPTEHQDHVLRPTELTHHRVSVIELEESLGSRKLGADIRTRLENYLRAGAKFVVLDFKGVGVVSSSFADEVLAKLAMSMGELELRRRVLSTLHLLQIAVL